MVDFVRGISALVTFLTHHGSRLNIQRNWSLITGRGQATKREGHVKFYPYEKWGGGGGWKSFSHIPVLKGGHNKFWGSF